MSGYLSLGIEIAQKPQVPTLLDIGIMSFRHAHSLTQARLQGLRLCHLGFRVYVGIVVPPKKVKGHLLCYKGLMGERRRVEGLVLTAVRLFWKTSPWGFGTGKPLAREK